MMTLKNIKIRPGFRILTVLLLLACRSRVLADAVFDPTLIPDPSEPAESIIPRLILIFFAFIIFPVQLFARGRMLKRFDGSGWRIVIPFCGRYLEYRFYWKPKYFWINLCLWLYILAAGTAIYVLEDRKILTVLVLLMLAALAVWLINTVRMRMNTLETFGQKRILGLLELLGLGFVLDCLCAFTGKWIKEDKKLQEKRALQQEHIDNWE